MPAQCPICQSELVTNSVREVRASFKCPSKAHYVFYDQPRDLWLVTTKKSCRLLSNQGLHVETFRIQTIARYVFNKGNSGISELGRQLSEHMPTASFVPLGDGASADVFVYDPSTRYFCFIEVKTRGRTPKLNAGLSPDETQFGTRINSLDLPYFVVWFDESNNSLSWHRLGGSGFLEVTQPPWNQIGQ